MAARVSGDTVVLIVVGAFALSWLSLLIWVIAVWEHDRRRDRHRKRHR